MYMYLFALGFQLHNVLVYLYCISLNVCFRSFDGHDEEVALEVNEEGTLDAAKDTKIALSQMPIWLSNSTPDEFLVLATSTCSKYLLSLVLTSSLLN